MEILRTNRALATFLIGSVMSLIGSFSSKSPDIQKSARPDYSSTFKMNYLIYLLLLLILACSVGPAGSGSDPDKLQKTVYYYEVAYGNMSKNGN